MKLDKIENIVSEPRRVTDYTVSGECSNCGNCCGDYLPVSDKEMNKIRKYVKSHSIKESKSSLMNVLTTPTDILDTTCPFRDNVSGTCKIYPVRPLICQSFICSETEEDIMANRAKISKNRKCRSFRLEIYGDRTNATLGFSLGVYTMDQIAKFVREGVK